MPLTLIRLDLASMLLVPTTVAEIVVAEMARRYDGHHRAAVKRY